MHRSTPLKRLGFALAVALVSAGCGGGGGETVYGDDESAACLEGRGFDISREDADYIALGAVNGGYLVDVGETSLNISFYRNADDAQDIIGPYELFGVEEGPKLYTAENALLAWDDTPTDDERSSVDGCLTAEGETQAVTSLAEETTTTDQTEATTTTQASPAAPKTRRVAHILVRSKSRATSLLAQLRAGASFAALARKYSRDPAAKGTGGVLVISEGQTVPAFDKAAFALETGALSRPVRTQYGWHILKALGPVTSE